jgi:hypothetical protein
MMQDFLLSLFCLANGETLIEAIENNKYKRNKKVTKKGDTKILAPPFLWARHRRGQIVDVEY